MCEWVCVCVCMCARHSAPVTCAPSNPSNVLTSGPKNRLPLLQETGLVHGILGLSDLRTAIIDSLLKAGDISHCFLAHFEEQISEHCLSTRKRMIMPFY